MNQTTKQNPARHIKPLIASALLAISVNAYCSIAAHIEISAHSVLINAEPAPADLFSGTDYGNVVVAPVPPDTGTRTRYFIIRNASPEIGGSNLVLQGSIYVSGINAGDFAVTQQSPSTILGPGNTSPFQVTFNPTAVGTRSATVTILSNDPINTTFTFNVTGTGVAQAQAEPNLGLLVSGKKVSESTKTQSLNFKGTAYLSNPTSVAINGAQLLVFSQSTPLFDMNNAHLLFTRPVKSLKASTPLVDSVRNMKIKARTPISEPYLVFILEPPAGVTDSDYTNNIEVSFIGVY